MAHGRGLRSGAATLVVALVAPLALAFVGLVTLAAPAEASMTRAFAPRYQSNDTGDILLRGNSLVTCPISTACTNAINRVGSGNALNNNGYPMQFVDVDSDSSTTSSSSALVTIPAGATISWAGLYWSGYTGGGGRTAPPGTTAKNKLKLKVPGASGYQDVIAAPASPTNPVDGPSTGAPYVSFADVTSLVRAAGAGTYTGANIFAATGTDSYAAWSLVLAVHSSTYPQRNLKVFDGFGTIQATPTADNSLDIPLTGLSTPPSGAVDVRLGAVVFEGDAGSVGDSFKFTAPPVPPAAAVTTTLTNTLNPPDNAFNSTVSDAGTAVAGRTPDGNTFGYDADVFESSILIGNAATTATLSLTTGGETFFPAVVSFVSNIYAPRLDVDRTATVIDTVLDGRTRPGDRIKYTVDVTNNGNDDSVDTRIAEAIPAGTTYVPGSLSVDGTSVSDGADSDQGEVSAGTLNLRLGSSPGGSGGSGGSMSPTTASKHTRFTYTVEITAPYTAGGTVTGSTPITYADSSSRTFSGASAVTTTTVVPARADLAVTQSASPNLVQVTGSRTVTWTATVTNNGPETETAPVLVENLPAGVTSVSVGSATCTNSGTTYTCPLPVLANGAVSTVTFTATLATTPDPATAVATVSGDGTDSTATNNTASTGVGVNTAPVAHADTAPLNSPALQIDIDVLNNDTDANPGDTLTISAPTSPAHGTTAIVAGKVRYTLTDTAFIGTDTFSYTVCDGRLGCDTATVSVPVNNHRSADLAVTHTATPTLIQRSGGSATVVWTATVTNNGPQDEPNPVLVEVLPAGVTGVSVSGATCTTTATYTYTCPLAALANGVDSTVTFTATLAAVPADPTTATATVHGDSADPTASNDSAAAAVGVNAAPTANADVAALNAPASQIDIDVRANDTDPDSADTLTVGTLTAPAHGSATVVGGKVRYVLTDVNFVGPDSFSYTVCDGRGGCDTSTVTVPVNDHRRADLSLVQIGTPSVVQRGGPSSVVWSVTITNNGPQPEPSPVLVEDLPAGLTGITVVGATCTVVANQYTCALPALASGASVAVGFSATIPATAPDPMTATAAVSGSITDPDPASNSTTTSIGVNLPPVAVADAAVLGASALSVDVDAGLNDTDPDGDPLTISSVGSATHGTLAVVNGKIRYTLTDYDFTGTESVSYTICDGRLACATATVTIAVADHTVADLKVASVVKPKLLQRNGSRIATWKVTVTNAGPNAEPRPVLAQTLPTGASAIDVSVTGCTTSAGTLTCPLSALAAGASTEITVTATLPAGTADPARATAVVSGRNVDPNPADNTAVAPVALNTAPVPDNDGATLPGSASQVTIDVLAGDVDADGDPLAVSSVSRPKHGTATIVGGKIRYTLTDLSFAGDDSFSYTVCDDRSGCSTAVVTVQVADHNRAPVATQDAATIRPDQVVIIDVVANDKDPDGDDLRPTRITGPPDHGKAVIRNGRLRYTPTAGFTGIDTLQYEVCDPGGKCDRATVTVHVTSNPPVAAPDAGTVKPGGTTVVNVLDNDVDPAGYQLGNVVITQPPSSGTATVGADGTIHYQASGSAQAGSTVTVGYRTCDATGACADGTVQFTVAGSPSTGTDLAYTGGDIGPLILIALSLTVLGGVVTVRARQAMRVRPSRQSRP